jgi:hypothetical protein
MPRPVLLLLALCCGCTQRPPPEEAARQGLGGDLAAALVPRELAQAEEPEQGLALAAPVERENTTARAEPGACDQARDLREQLELLVLRKRDAARDRRRVRQLHQVQAATQGEFAEADGKLREVDDALAHARQRLAQVQVACAAASR